MQYVLIILLSTGSSSRLNFESPKACDQARKAVIMSTIPKMQSAFCIEESKPKEVCHAKKK